MMGISFQRELKNNIKTMYNDILDLYLEESKQNPSLSKVELLERTKDVKEWKKEFRDMINDLHVR